MHQHLTPEDAALAQGVPLSLRATRDIRFWGAADDGIFTTKSGYLVGRLSHIRGWELHFGSTAAVAWKRVWNIEGPPKLRNFLWRACTGPLATLGRLHQRHIRESGLCGCCGGGEESILHALFRCSNVKSMWDMSIFAGLLVDAPFSSFVDLLLWVISKVSKDELMLFVSMVWAAWAYRNSVVFGEPWNNRDIGVLGFTKLVGDYSKYMGAVTPPVRCVAAVSRSGWSPPATGWMRINVDTAVREGWGVGLGAVIRDDHGKIVAVMVRKMSTLVSVKMAEALAARMGVCLAKDLGVQQVDLECDSTFVVAAINKPRDGRAPEDLIFDDIVCLLIINEKNNLKEREFEEKNLRREKREEEQFDERENGNRENEKTLGKKNILMNNHNNLDLGHVQTMAEIDRISNLPDELISEIVSRLSVEEAATTCVSSKRWRDVFALITRLEFDHSCEYTLEQHNKFVDNALRACRSERITMFRLRILINQSYVPMEYKRVNHWMSFALSRGVKHLEVVAFLIDHDKLPLALFECQTLETLTLVLNVNFEVPSTYNLPNLKVLCLHFASFRDEDFITRLVSRSPLLERLDLLGIRECFQHINDVISAPFLTTLYINLLMFRENQRNTSKLLLDAPNLKYLDYSLSLESQYCIGDLNSLVGAKLNMPLNEVRLFRSMSNVRRLHLGSTCMKLNCAWSHSYHQVVLEMLHASPVLETIFFEPKGYCSKGKYRGYQKAHQIIQSRREQDDYDFNTTDSHSDADYDPTPPATAANTAGEATTAAANENPCWNSPKFPAKVGRGRRRFWKNRLKKEAAQGTRAMAI
uniref:F-box domain-containing protein n=1 Tax=Chenopodium quinoa TaxID=63459 RepID=A0A803LAH5_CHEQI